jgi:hypothetical protein
MKEQIDVLAKPMSEANAVFQKMQAVVEEEVKRGATNLNVVEVARKAGLEVDEKILDELKIDQFIPVHSWLPWHYWWPWRPFWCWWWRRYPWYRCCAFWWYRCHWYPL